ncbi:aminotransferase class V-fold PLP-dependent enzyme [Ginsengibacter hankyongi]|uniref:Aminotransferase class V-fold PLP-dependent enzyme n=1 Tax=Ginsengibacter hankyongi TaxID=2607284 RepID=A0A5J5IH38_9BACT|nr:aminotransferase class V-fold PLP-dependent enzyme [Ginsengibacter hankyongi]KAA9038370.1 aminotransferase class V-fold PLP-dependent enzyme [Ginsengibacter hankyongi]
MTNNRNSPIEISKAEFKKVGYQLIDTISDFMNTIDERPVTTGETPAQIQNVLGNSSLPEDGVPVSALVSKTADLLLNHSLLNGHPKFFGYITSSPTPIGALADLLAAAVNPNVGANILSPIATEIEKQTIKWLAEFIGIAPSCGGILVSGGNMANFTAFLAARTAKAPKSIKETGLMNMHDEMILYCSKATHTWVEKAAVLFGHGTKAIRWIPADADNKMKTEILSQTIKDDLNKGKKPFLVIANAGDVSTGAVDNLSEIAAICKAHDLWFHVDGAYGIPAAVIPRYKNMFKGIEEADSIALDPHKWLYAPLEAGCTLVKNPQHLVDTYSAHPVYYNFDNSEDEPSLNFYEYGLQNSRGFRALKVWMALQQAGKNGYIEMINKNIELSQLLFEEAKKHPEIEAISNNLSITTFRYVPADYLQDEKINETYLNGLNEKLLNELQRGGELFLSNAVVADKYCLRACIVNFRTSAKDIVEIIEIIAREGKQLHQKFSSKAG